MSLTKRMFKRLISNKNRVFVLIVLLQFVGVSYSQTNNLISTIKKEARPWTYWWWPGSAVDSANITYNLELFSKAGIGGVHIIPIYGVKGYEEKFIDFLSPQWMKMLAYSSRECERLGMGLDMTLGTGWPFGGSQVSDENSSSRLLDTVLTIRKNTSVNINLTDLIKAKTKNGQHVKLVAANAYYNNNCIDLFKYIDGQNNLIWNNPEEDSQVIILFMENSIQQVKRAAPGGKGNVVDPFSAKALENYLQTFENAFSNYNGNPVRAFYHDSYEYYGADWSPTLPAEFLKRRGYDLLKMMPAYLGKADSINAARIKCDYRNTISELHEEFIKNAAQWSARYGAGFRCQAHGSPANLLDVYAAAPIPETEVFGTPKTNIDGLTIDTAFSRKESVEPLLMKFASSAAHVTNKNLVSSETGTWLTEHFRESLALVKSEVDQLFVSGINHIFFHGIPYSPKEEEWPGWQFYAATNYGPANSLWRNLPELTNYIARCQTVLQEGEPYNSLLLYFPIWDIWNNNSDGLNFLQMHNPEAWLFNSDFYKTANDLINKGFSFDYISDKQIEKLISEKGELLSSKIRYKAIVIPSCKYIPIETLAKLNELTRSGVKVIFIDQIPGDVPGYFKYRERREQLKNIINQLLSEHNDKKSSIFIGNINTILEQLSHVNEVGFAKAGLSFIKRKSINSINYFIVNQASKTINKWIETSEKGRTVIIIDPLNGKNGLAKTKTNSDGTLSVYLLIESGASLIFKIYNNEQQAGNWKYTESINSGYEIKGEWNVEFIEGGPLLPEPKKLKQLTSWTNFNDVECKRFFGTAKYKIKFHNPDPDVDSWMLDLGKVCESASIKINNIYVETVWAFPFLIKLENGLLKGGNDLEIEVTNNAANRIRNLDKRCVNWKKFYDVNFVNINYKKFDASVWDIANSGLLGPVKLIPQRIIK